MLYAETVISRIEHRDCLSFRNNAAEVYGDRANTSGDFYADCCLIVCGESAVGGDSFAERCFGNERGFDFTRFLFARGRVDYDSLASNVKGQFLLGWTPNPGTAFYVGYNDDLNRNGFSPFTGRLEPGFRRNGRTFFIKMSYLIRRSF